MELRQYWSIIRSRMWMIALLTLATFAFSLLYTPRAAASYKATVRLAVKPQVEARASDYYTYDEYYAYVASEYLNDDVAQVVEGGAFMNQLRERAQRDAGRSPAGSLEVKKAHRVLMIHGMAGTADDSLLLAKTAAEMLVEPGASYFKDISEQNPRVTVVDPPAVVSATPASRIGLDIVIRTLLGLFAGVALAFVLEYLDDTVRNGTELENELGLPVLGEIPRERKTRRRRAKVAPV